MLLILLLIIGCEGPEGPEGPAGPAGSSLPVFINGSIYWNESEDWQGYTGNLSAYNCPSVPLVIINETEFEYYGVPKNPFNFSFNDMEVSTGDSVFIGIYYSDTQNNPKEAYANILIPDFDIITPDSTTFMYNPNYDFPIEWTKGGGKSKL